MVRGGFFARTPAIGDRRCRGQPRAADGVPEILPRGNGSHPAWRAVTGDVIAEVERDAAEPAARLRLLIQRVIETAERDPIGVALLASASHPAVAAALARVTEQRISYNVRLFGEIGFAPTEARRRALIAYSAYLGHAELARSTPQVLPRGRADVLTYLDHVLSLLTTRVT